ncbi:hypothetical protein E4U15_003164, partial [Claviceps sp. LM218 group G6]
MDDACHQSRFSSTVRSHSPSRASLRCTSSPGSTPYWVEVSWGSEKSERFERKGVYDVGQRGLRQGFSRRGTDPDVACAGRERSVARDEHIPELGRALSGEVVGEQTFYSDAVCADCLGDIKIRRCRHHGRGGFFLAHGNGEDSEGSEFDMVGVGKYFAARAGGHKPRRMVQNLSALLEGEVQRRNLAADFHLMRRCSHRWELGMATLPKFSMTFWHCNLKLQRVGEKLACRSEYHRASIAGTGALPVTSR